MEKGQLKLLMGEVLQVRPRPISLDQPESDTSTSLVPKELLLKEQEETRRLKEKCQRLEHELALERKERRRIADVLLSKLGMCSNVATWHSLSNLF